MNEMKSEPAKEQNFEQQKIWIIHGEIWSGMIK